MVLNLLKVAVLLIVWAFFLGLVGFGLNWATVLIIIGSILYLLAA